MSTQILGQNAQSQDILWIDNEVLENQSADAQQWCLERSASMVGQIDGVDAVWQNNLPLWSQLQPCQDWAAYFGFQCSFTDPDGKDLFWKTGAALETQSQACQDWIAANNVFLMPVSKFNPENPDYPESTPAMDGFWRQGLTLYNQDEGTQIRFNNVLSIPCDELYTRERKLKPDGTAYPDQVWRYTNRVLIYKTLGLSINIDFSYLHDFGEPNMFDDCTEYLTLSEIEITA